MKRRVAESAYSDTHTRQLTAMSLKSLDSLNDDGRKSRSSCRAYAHKGDTEPRWSWQEEPQIVTKKRGEIEKTPTTRT